MAIHPERRQLSDELHARPFHDFDGLAGLSAMSFFMTIQIKILSAISMTG